MDFHLHKFISKIFFKNQMQLIDFKRRNYHTLRMFPQSLNPSKSHIRDLSCYHTLPLITYLQSNEGGRKILCSQVNTFLSELRNISSSDQTPTKDGDAKFSLRNVAGVKLSIMSEKVFSFCFILKSLTNYAIPKTEMPNFHSEMWQA